MAQFQHSSLERGKAALGLSAVASTVCVLRQRLPAAARCCQPGKPLLRLPLASAASLGHSWPGGSQAVPRARDCLSAMPGFEFVFY